MNVRFLTNEDKQEQAKALDDMFKKCAFTGDVSTEYEAFKIAFGLTDSGEVEPDTPVEPDVPEDVTLTSISATYTGGNVVVGTSVNDLTGITVKATYSDGSTKNVTGYTLSGTIAEGTNTITVSYGGMTTTFTVTGVAESSGEEEWDGVVKDTSVKIAKTGYGFTANGQDEYKRDVLAISEYYDIPSGYTGKLSYFYPDDSTSGIGQYMKLQMRDDSDAFVDYYSLSVGTAEKTVSFMAVSASQSATKFRFSIEIANVDDCYMYYTETGDIVFAGKNTQYYGMKNIDGTMV